MAPLVDLLVSRLGELHLIVHYLTRPISNSSLSWSSVIGDSFSLPPWMSRSVQSSSKSSFQFLKELSLQGMATLQRGDIVIGYCRSRLSISAGIGVRLWCGKNSRVWRNGDSFEMRVHIGL